MVRNKLHWDANEAVGLSKQREVGLDCYEFLCFGSPTALFASQCNLLLVVIKDYESAFDDVTLIQIP